MDNPTKGVTFFERFDALIMSRAEPSRAEPSRAEPSRAEPSRAEPSTHLVTLRPLAPVTPPAALRRVRVLSFERSTSLRGSGEAALLAALMFLLAGAPAHAQSVVWNATLTSANNWALGSTYTYDGYGSSAVDFLTTTHGSLSPGSFTVDGTTHTVELLGVRGGTDNESSDVGQRSLRS